MSPDTFRLHAGRVERLLSDLQLEPGGLMAGQGFSLVDTVTGRRLTPPLHNQTLAEGLASALKIAAAAVQGDLS